MSKVISKEDLVPMDAPGDGWHHIESNEEHPAQRRSAAADGSGVTSEIVQVLDNAAAGWVRELAVFDDGAGNMQLAGRIEWTPLGLPGAWGALRVELTLTNPEES